MDEGHRLTEEELAALEARIFDVYQEAYHGLTESIESYFLSFKEKDKIMQQKLEAGEITQDEYIQWRLSAMTRTERFEALRDLMAQRMTAANEVAMAYVNDATPGVYSLNRNYMAYTFEKAGGVMASFTLFDEATVKRLIVEDPDLMPNYPKEKAVNRGIDLAWGKKQITAAATSGILQGKSIPNIAKDLQKRIVDMDRTAAIRAARTATTGAQNAGRLDSSLAAQKMGIEHSLRWIATKDGRTRHSHRRLDGETTEPGKKFSNGCRYPGDSRGKPAETYNCRCTMRTIIKGVREAEPRIMRVRDTKTGKSVLVNAMTYQEWEAWKKAESVEYAKKSDIIKPDKIVSGHAATPKKATPGMVIDHKNKNGVVNVRSFYGENGLKEKDIHTNDHGYPNQHKFGQHGEHAHDYEWDKNERLKNKTTREISQEERKGSSDIL